MPRLEPRKRELVVVLGLFLTLLYLRGGGFSLFSTSDDSDDLELSQDPVTTVGDIVNPSKPVSPQKALVEPYYAPDYKLSWRYAVPESSLVSHVWGWTIVDNLYILNGTLFVVTSEPEAWPDRQYMTSTGYPNYPGVEEIQKRKPGDKEMQIITPERAQEIFGTHYAMRLDGVTFHINDPKQFLSHYYHWSAELLFGIWRSYSSLDPHISADGSTTLPAPSRFMLPRITASEWRDYAHMNEWVTRGAFPRAALEFADALAERADTNIPIVLERVVLADRSAASESKVFGETMRTVATAFELPGSPHWWAPLRRAVLEFSGVPKEWIYGPDPAALVENRKLVITYISRQTWGRRMLRSEDHDQLVEELYGLRDRYGYEVNIVSMQDLSRAEQFNLAARTTIMMGVHGNGLTSLLWMRPTPRSTVIEFFIPNGFAFDYQYTTHALGMVHYGVWNNITFTHPNIPDRQRYPDGFQGNEIPVDGAVVAKLVHRRLSLGSDVDDSAS